jgi:site-specific DNA-methyltransferase (adenine-specific)
MILNLDCRHGLAMLPDNSVDAIVCDPPYGLRFMGKKWDYDVPGVDIWAECLRVLKPGGRLLAFAGTRTQHRMAVRIEDAGVDIWVECLRVLKPGGHLLAFAGTRTQHRMAVRIEDAGFEIRDMIAWVYGRGYPKHRSSLKPALEPITMARKPAERATLLNIDACRVGDEVRYNPPVGELTGYGSTRTAPKGDGQEVTGRYPANLIHDGSDEVLAHFPDCAGSGGSVPNVKISGYGDGVVGTGSAEYLGGERTKVDCGTGSAARFFYCAKASKKDRNEGLEAFDAVMANFAAGTGLSKNGDGSPRNMNADAKNPHPTVKPTELMRYLCRLVTPPGGLIVDPFAGSGSTGKAAILEGFQFVGFELDPQYTAIANARLEAARTSMKESA